MRGQVVRFDADMINDFLDTPVILEDGEEYPAYARYLSTHPDPDSIATTLYTPGGRFVLNADGLPWKLLRKDMMTLLRHGVSSLIMILHPLLTHLMLTLTGHA